MSLENANDRSTKVVTVAFKDEDENAVVPTSAVWTLTNELGAVVNSRQQIEITPLAESVDIILTNDDLAWEAGQSRHLIIEAVYNGIQVGLTLTGETDFAINDLQFIT